MTMAKVRSKVANKKVQDLSKRKASGRVSKALNGTLTLRSKQDEYPPIYTQKAKYQKVANEFGRKIHAVQKVRGSSIPLI